MHLTLMQKVLWAAGLIAPTCLFCVLVIRKRARKYWPLTLYVGFVAANTIVLYAVHKFGTHQQYANCYWSSAVVDYLLQATLVIALTLSVIRPNGKWLPGALRNLILWGTVGVICSGFIASLATPADAKGWDLWSSRANIFSGFLFSGIFIAMSASANRLGLRRRSHTLALGLGFTVWQFACLLEGFLYLIRGFDPYSAISEGRMWVWVLVHVYWSVAFWFPETQRENAPPEVLVALHESVQYDLKRIDGGAK